MKNPKRSSRMQEVHLRYLAAVLLMAFLSTAVVAAPADLDPTFGGTGIVNTKGFSFSFAAAMAIQTHVSILGTSEP